jgi:anti-sigma28 factor (negative regulator of flagellin synthesis)
MRTSLTSSGNASISSTRLRAVRLGDRDGVASDPKPLAEPDTTIDEAKVARLREALARGELHVDADRIAARILGELEEAPHPAPRGACYPALPCPSPRTISSSVAASRA